LIQHLLLLSLCLSATWVHAVEMTDIKRQQVMQALQAGTDPNVKALSDNDVLVLKAVMALDEGRTEQALGVLHQPSVKKDPLLVMLEAEAYRRAAIESVEQAGEYAKGFIRQKALLQEADLSMGLREANVRLSLLSDKLDGVSGFPLDLLQVDEKIYSVFLVDKARSRLFVYARNGNGQLERVADEYVVTGAKQGDKQEEGDARTPNGVYRFVEKLQGHGLEARYGPVAYPIDYPNALDALHRKDGSGIWLHGFAEGVGRRPPRDTKGCFALPNSRLLAMAEYIQLGRSWVVVGKNFVFNDEPLRQEVALSVKQSIEAWRKDWSARDTPAYLSHYHPHFRSGSSDLMAWTRYKTRVNASKSFIDVALAKLTLVHDPNMWPEGDVVVAEFDQTYRSDNYQDITRKRLYLARKSTESDWKILLEETL